MTQAPFDRRMVPRDTPEGVQIAALVALAADRLHDRLDELVESLTTTIKSAEAHLGDPELDAMLRASVEANVSTIIQMLRLDIPLEHLQSIAAATEYAIRLAQRDVPEAALRRAYHIGSDDLLGYVFEEVQAIDCDGDTRLRILHHIAGWMHKYVDWISRDILSAYNTERQRWLEQTASTTASLVRGLLGGVHTDHREFAELTGYELEQFHIGGLLWIENANPAVDHVRSLEDLARAMGSTVSVHSRSLVTPVDRNTAWVWFGHSTELRVDTTTLGQTLRTVPGARLALGAQSHGVDGFRTTLEQAGAVRPIVNAAGPGVEALAYSDRNVAVAAMLAKDPRALASWLTATLGPLAGEGDSLKSLRETLRQFLANGSNYQLTAQEETLHRNTVKYRVKRAESVRGRPIHEDRLELELALEVFHLLGDNPRLLA